MIVVRNKSAVKIAIHNAAMKFTNSEITDTPEEMEM